MTRPDTPTADEYRDVVDEYAEIALEYALEDYPDAPHNADLYGIMVDTLDGHEWFGQYRAGLTCEGFGAVVDHSESDPSLHRDMGTLTDSDDATEVFKRLAFAHFEADVFETARRKIENEVPA